VADVVFPNQPAALDEHGVYRFRKNRLVCYLLDSGPFTMNDLSIVSQTFGLSKEEQAQFAQLIGYSVSGWGDLSYVSPEKYASVPPPPGEKPKPAPDPEKLLDLLEEVADVLDNYSDVRDGDEGEHPYPNRAMEMLSRVEETLDRFGRSWK
jgi:hypothetical protein